MKIGDPVRLQLAHGETGHGAVVAFNPLTVKVDNIPFDGSWNLHDTALAELQPSLGKNCDDFYDLTQLVERKYSMRSTVLYDQVKQFHAFAKAVTEAGGAVEGWTTPEGGRRGMLGCAHTPAIKIREIAKRHGCSVERTSVLGVPA